MKTLKRNSYFEREKFLESRFISEGPFFHLYTNGNESQILFTHDEEFKCAINYIAYSAKSFPEISIYTFTVMSNHFHFIVSGDREIIQEFFYFFRRKLKRFFTENNRIIDTSKIECQILKIESLKALRNEIVYTNRNGYVVDSSCSFNTYLWGAGAYFFNPLAKMILARKCKDLTIRELRHLCSSKNIEIIKDCSIVNDMILPTSFCKITEAEEYFADAHMYSHLISRNSEAFSAISQKIKDSIFLTYNELYSAISNICKQKYGQNMPNLLSPSEKIEVAKLMRFNYNASLGQIRSILNLNIEVVQSLFPEAS